MIKNGLYRHFKGDLYYVVGQARHSETDEILVIYHPLSEPTNLFARPLTMFCEIVERGTGMVKGTKVPRFQFERA